MIDKCPFKKFPYKGLRDVVFVWPFEPPKKIGSFHIPDVIRENTEIEYGVVLSAGKGYYTNKGKFRPTRVVEGDVVIYDKTVPWVIEIEGQKVKYMGYADVKGTVNELEGVGINI